MRLYHATRESRLELLLESGYVRAKSCFATDPRTAVTYASRYSAVTERCKVWGFDMEPRTHGLERDKEHEAIPYGPGDAYIARRPADLCDAVEELEAVCCFRALSVYHACLASMRKLEGPPPLRWLEFPMELDGRRVSSDEFIDSLTPEQLSHFKERAREWSASATDRSNLFTRRRTV